MAATYLSSLTHVTKDLLQDRKVQQCGAICYRFEQETLQVLLVTSRENGRWVIPKGSLEENERPHKCAAREASEETGVLGKVFKKPLGHYTYVKNPKKSPYVVCVHLLRYEGESIDFKERGQRIMEWMAPHRAAALVEEPELKGLFRMMMSSPPPR